MKASFQNGDGRLTLEEFRSMANKKDENLMEWNVILLGKMKSMCLCEPT